MVDVRKTETAVRVARYTRRTSRGNQDIYATDLPHTAQRGYLEGAL